MKDKTSQNKPEWIKKIQKGDLLRTDSGKLRVVRHVSHGHSKYDNGFAQSVAKTYVAFSIRKCSWTRRPYTIKTGVELRKWSPLGRNIKLNKKIDRQIEKELDNHRHREVYCHEVEGIL